MCPWHLCVKSPTSCFERRKLFGRAAARTGTQRQRRLGRLPVRERLALLLDEGRPFFELGIWAAHGMYSEWGDVPAAGIVTGIGWVSGRPCLVAANDATVKAGAMFPQSVKKLLRAQRIAFQFRLPLIYLVDSAGVFLPLQDEIFPDEDDFGRIFRNNAVLSAAGIPQFAAVMGNCIAGGAYLPVLCDKLLMTDGSQLCLAGPALVKAAIGQDVDPEELGGAAMHAAISGTVDFHEPDDAVVPAAAAVAGRAAAESRHAIPRHLTATRETMRRPDTPSADRIYDLVPADGRGEYDVRDVLACIVDDDSLQEYKAEFGQTLVTAFAKIGGHAVGIVANQKQRCRTAGGELQIGGVIYPDAADKAARFVMDCNQSRVPIVFLQDVQGFMVGQAGRAGGHHSRRAKLVNVVSNSIVPKLTVIIGGSFGAGNYALCGKAYDPALILAWPSAKYAVMGADQAAETLLALQLRDAKRAGKTLSDDEIAELRRVDPRALRRADRYPLRRGPRLGRRHHPPARNAALAANGARPAAARHASRADFRTGVLQV